MKCIKTIMLVTIMLAIVVPGTVFAQETDEMITVGVLSFYPPLQPIADGFIEGMAELGYVEGENITYIREGPLESFDEETMYEVAQSIVDADVDLLFGALEDEAQIFQELTSDIPIVFGIVYNPVGLGLVESVTEPGGNITGIEDGLSDARRLQIMTEIDPTIEKVYVTYNPANPEGLAILEAIEELAEELDLEIYPVEVIDHEDALAAIENMPDDTDALFLTPGGEMRDEEVNAEWQAASERLQFMVTAPAISYMPGLLLGYGIDFYSIGEQASGIADRILRGADPADLPVETVEFFLMLNLEAAEAIDLDIPRSILRQADIIIRPGDINEPEETPEGDE